MTENAVVPVPALRPDGNEARDGSRNWAPGAKSSSAPPLSCCMPRLLPLWWSACRSPASGCQRI